MRIGYRDLWLSAALLLAAMPSYGQDTGAWTCVTAGGNVGFRGMVFDDGRKKPISVDRRSNLSEWDASQRAWRASPVDSPTGYYSGIAYDSTRGQDILVSESRSVYRSSGNGDAWQVVAEDVPKFSAVAYDKGRARVVAVYWGSGARTDWLTWEFDPATNTVSAIVAGRFPDGPTDASGGLVYDDARGKVVLLMGDGVLAWDGAAGAWSPIASGGPRYPEAVAYDSDRDRLVVVGTADASSGQRKTFEWDGSSWFSGDGAPRSRASLCMTYDPVEKAIVLGDWAGGVWTYTAPAPQPPPQPSASIGPLNDVSGQEGSPISFVVPATGSVSAWSLPDGATFDPSSHTFRWTPSAGQAGSYYLTFYIVSLDGGYRELDASMTITVAPAPAPAPRNAVSLTRASDAPRWDGYTPSHIAYRDFSDSWVSIVPAPGQPGYVNIALHLQQPNPAAGSGFYAYDFAYTLPLPSVDPWGGFSAYSMSTDFGALWAFVSYDGSVLTIDVKLNVADGSSGTYGHWTGSVQTGG